ncbi:MAG TPA: polyprenol monophosphomannose synthase [Terriglobales bacterium]|nr:polyprenol monophosphomannose synthase [Terriglobales bacterium]
MSLTNGAQKFVLVIPTLNEAGNIPTLIDRVQAALLSLPIDYEILIVDDDSQDGTAEVVERYSERDRRIRLLVRKGQRGLAGAVIHGWAHSDADLLGVMDADLQHPPETLPRLLDAMDKGADIAVASRYATGENCVGNWNKFRQLVSRVSTWITVPLQSKKGVRVKDPMSGFFIVRRDCVEGLDLQPYGFKILLEILVKGRIKNPVEVPFQFATRYSGKSKADLRVALHYFSLLGKLSRHAIFRPGQQ